MDASEIVDIIDQIKNEVQANSSAYMLDPDYSSLIDEILNGKLSAIRYLCKKNGLNELYEEINSYLPINNNAIGFLEFFDSISGDFLVDPITNSERLEIVNNIAQFMQDNMKTTEINVYFGGYPINFEREQIPRSKRIYVENILSDVSIDLIIEIAKDLGIFYTSPSDHAISDIIDEYGEGYITEEWKKALERRSTDPKGAITIANTMIESTCKYILDKKGIKYTNKDGTNSLYSKTSDCLNLSPAKHTDGIVKQILGGCNSIALGIGSLRNKISDSHGQGVDKVNPHERHAILTVNAAGSLCAFLLQTYIARLDNEA